MKPTKDNHHSTSRRSVHKAPSQKAKHRVFAAQGRPKVHWSYEGPESDVWKLPVPQRPDLTTLKMFLVTYAGTRFQRNDYLAKALSPKLTKQLAQEGRFFPGNNAILFRMQPNECDLNSELLGADPRAEKWVGLALDDDPCWRVHCWLVRRKDRRLIETTLKRTLYFGMRVPISKEVKKLYASKRVGLLPHIQALFDAHSDLNGAQDEGGI